MKTEIKAALAGTVGGALLLGGAGTLAYWKDSETVTGTDVASGTLTLTPAATPCTDWALDSAGGATTYVGGTTKLVPGDVLSRTCTYTVAAAGAHLAAELAVETPTYSATNALTSALAVASAFKVGTATRTTVTSADDTKSVEAVIKVTFNSSTSGTTAQGMTATLNNLSVTLTQTHA